MIIYGSSLSPFVRKTVAYVAEKGIDVEVKPIGLGSADPDFAVCSPFRKMPAFRDGDFAISDSTAIITYLETKFPQPPLLPAEAKSRARTVWYEEFADTILVACMGKMFFNILCAIAEFESDVIGENTRAGMKLARSKGHIPGPKIDPRKGPSRVTLWRRSKLA